MQVTHEHHPYGMFVENTANVAQTAAAPEVQNTGNTLSKGAYAALFLASAATVAIMAIALM